MKQLRLLLKLSGEALMDKEERISPSALEKVAQELASLRQAGHRVGLVIGGGNLFRGLQLGSQLSLDRSVSDQMGMLATLINGIALEEAVKRAGCSVALFSALEAPAVARRYRWQEAMEALAGGEVVIFVGGTGHPYFTTDSCAALRASEIHADLLLKATTRVDGVYDRDPLKVEGAVRYSSLSARELIEKRLGIMDLTAVALCMASSIPIRVFNFFAAPLRDVVEGGSIGSLITP